MSNRVKAFFALLLLAMIWGLATVFQRSGMDTIGPYFFVGIRGVYAGTALLLIYLVSERFHKGREDAASAEEKRNATRLSIRTGILVGLINYGGYITQQIGFVTVEAGKGAFLCTLTVILVPIFGLFLGHRTNLMIWIGVALAIAGIYFLCLFGSTDFSLRTGELLMLVCAVFGATSTLVIDRVAVGVNAALMSCVMSYTLGGVGLMVAPFVEDFSWTGLMGALPELSYLAILSTGVCALLQVYAQRYSDPTVTTIMLSLESPFALIFGFLFLHEVLSGHEFVGCVFMLAAVLISQLPMPGSKGTEGKKAEG